MTDTTTQLIEVTPALAAAWLGIREGIPLEEAVSSAFRGVAFRSTPLRQALQGLRDYGHEIWKRENDRIEKRVLMCRTLKAARFAKMMSSGEWVIGAEEDPIFVRGSLAEGRCTAGRYRLLGAVKAGKPVRLRVQFV